MSSAGSGQPVEAVRTADGRRTYDVEASNAFEAALRNRPSAWDVRIAPSGELQVRALCPPARWAARSCTHGMRRCTNGVCHD